MCFYDFIETQTTYFLFLLENATRKKLNHSLMEQTSLAALLKLPASSFFMTRSVSLKLSVKELSTTLLAKPDRHNAYITTTSGPV